AFVALDDVDVESHALLHEGREDEDGGARPARAEDDLLASLQVSDRADGVPGLDESEIAVVPIGGRAADPGELERIETDTRLLQHIGLRDRAPEDRHEGAILGRYVVDVVGGLDAT